MSDLISIIIPIYNPNEEYLNECIKSVLKQSYHNLQIILVDDGSQEYIQKQCHRLSQMDHRIEYYRKENGGVSSARNYGLELAKGKYINFLDADDYITPDYMRQLYNMTPGHTLVCSGHKKIFLTKSIEHPAYNQIDKYNMDVIGTVWGKLYESVNNILSDIITI